MDYRKRPEHDAFVINVEIAKPRDLAEQVPQGAHVAAVLMTHNYEIDLEIMRKLRLGQFGYLGCLGPKSRFVRMKQDLFSLYAEEIPSSLENIVAAPAGIFERGNSTNEIALSVVAQIQDRLVESVGGTVATLILAAGESRRFGSAKALSTFGGRTLLQNAVNLAAQISPGDITIVTGGHAKAIVRHLEDCKIDGVTVVFNRQWQEGMGTSLACGITARTGNGTGPSVIVILPVDQPLVTLKHVQCLVREARKSKRCALSIDAQGVSGAPAAIVSEFYPRAVEIHGDRGMKSVLRPSEIIYVEDPLSVLDVDTPEDLARLEQCHQHTSS